MPLLLIDTGTGAFDFSHSYLYRFDSVANLVFTDADVGAVPYVPTSAEATEAAAEYQAWCVRAGQPLNQQVVTLLTNADAVKAELLAYVDKQTAKFEDNLNKEMYFTSSLGFKVNGDRRTKDNLQDLITFFDLQAKEGKISYRDYDNQDQALTKEQLQTLLTEHVTNGQMLYTIKWQLQSKINAAESLDDLHNITIAFPMCDFSKKADVDTGLVE